MYTIHASMVVLFGLECWAKFVRLGGLIFFTPFSGGTGRRVVIDHWSRTHYQNMLNTKISSPTFEQCQYHWRQSRLILCKKKRCWAVVFKRLTCLASSTLLGSAPDCPPIWRWSKRPSLWLPTRTCGFEECKELEKETWRHQVHLSTGMKTLPMSGGSTLSN